MRAKPVAWPTTAPMRRLRGLDRRIARQLRAHGRWAVGMHELVCFGVKQASACLFGGLMVALLLATWRWYPAAPPLARATTSSRSPRSRFS